MDHELPSCKLSGSEPNSIRGIIMLPTYDNRIKAKNKRQQNKTIATNLYHQTHHYSKHKMGVKQV